MLFLQPYLTISYLPKKIVAIMNVKIGKTAIRGTTTEGSPDLSA